MKKLIAVLLSLCLMIGAAAAFAENTPRSINWSDHESKAANGQFTNVTGTSLKMYVPAEFKSTELSDETFMRGTSMVLKSEKNDKVVVNAQTVSMDMAAFKANMEKKGINMSDDLTVNGRTVTQKTNADRPSAAAAFRATNPEVAFLFFRMRLRLYPAYHRESKSRIQAETSMPYTDCRLDGVSTALVSP